MSADDRVIERKLILKRAYPRHQLFKIGRQLGIPYFARVEDPWSMDEEQAALEIASAISDSQLKEVFTQHKPRKWAFFRGKYYTLEDGAFTLKGSWENMAAGLREVKDKYGRSGAEVLKILLQSGGSCSLKDIADQLKKPVNPAPIITDLERLKIVEVSYRGENYLEWKIPDEVYPLIQAELGAPAKTRVSPQAAEVAAGEGEVDYVELERQEIAKMDNMLNDYLADLLKHRLDATVKFGKTFSVRALADYLINLFGPVLYFDSFLSIIQQYGLAEVEIVHEKGKTGMRTGYNLALFGEPGTGKSFSTRDMILGKVDAKIYPHGIPGRNRYAAGMTPARFIRIGQAYAGRTFNFIVPEFNDWFKYKGMVEPLKLAMERGIIKYELHREVIGPYRFNSFFSVNYNVATYGRGYEVTVSDPNFNAVEDRMLCRLHRLTKKRFVEIAQSQRRLAFGEIDTEKGARKIRDHVTLVYAIETGHPLVRDRFPIKPILITPKVYEAIERARNAILECIPRESVAFSARLEDRAIRFACTASTLNYFGSSVDYIPVSDEALKYAVQLYVEEASVRSRQEFTPEEVLDRINV
ncbi:MAG: hypothetical protein RMK50_02845 [Nitrososphaerota archaeon]|nr:hypothetical protein [Candidatus Bathyarchaeota archaeon]MDW8193747.1 hypothetical protein [Nitrososphaerota archaeon]